MFTIGNLKIIQNFMKEEKISHNLISQKKKKGHLMPCSQIFFMHVHPLKIKVCQTIIKHTPNGRIQSTYPEGKGNEISKKKTDFLHLTVKHQQCPIFRI